MIFTVLILSACSDLNKEEDGSEGGNLPNLSISVMSSREEILKMRAEKEALKFISDINALAEYSIFKDLAKGSINDLGGVAYCDYGVYFASNGYRYEIRFTDDFAFLGKLLK